MAENETLDLRTSRRWENLCRLIQSQASKEDILEEVKSCLTKTLQNIGKRIPLTDMLVAAEQDPESIRKLGKNCHEAKDFVNLLQVCAEQAANGGADHDTVAEAFIWTIFDRFYDQICIKCVSAEGTHSFLELRQLGVSLRAELAPTVLELVGQLYHDTDHQTTTVRMPKMTAVQKSEQQRKLLEMSIL